MLLKTTDQFVRKAQEVHGDRYDYSNSIYTGRFTKLFIICKKHGEFFQTPGNHFCGKGCPLCRNEKLSRDKISSVEEFIEKSVSAHKNRYDYSQVVYKGSHAYVDIICPLHGKFSQLPSNHVKGVGCPKCGLLKLSKKFSSTTDAFIEKAIKIHGERYNYILTEYKNAKTKIKILCPKHGRFEQVPNHHLQGKGCPYCASSYGELEIKKYLDENGISYIPHKKFSDCRDIRPLPFDFFLPALNFAIEYDGKQHFLATDFSGTASKEKTQKNFILMRYRDEIKTKYCQGNGIKLLRIPYTQFKNIQGILNQKLKEV